jgi:hypothetical protein
MFLNRSLAWAFALAGVTGLVTPTYADTLTVTLAGSHVETITAGGVTFDHRQLVAGSSVGNHMMVQGTYGETAADDRNLETYFSRNGHGPSWDITLEDWTETNGDAHDFFLFEVGGNDTVSVQAILTDGTIGQAVSISGWSGTGHTVVTGPNAGQVVCGLAFKTSQLLDVSGAALPDGVALEGIRVLAANVDAAALLAVSPVFGPGLSGSGAGVVFRSGFVGQPVELIYFGPFACETDDAPNPFMDMRLDVTFDGPNGESYQVPGFFAGDARGGECGKLWMARFLPPSAGDWTATASFRTGTNVAQYLAQTAGTPGVIHGTTLNFTIAPEETLATGFLRSGHLAYVNDHYQKFERGPYFIKTGSNSPENWLACRAFDGVGKTLGSTGVLHSYEAHIGDWKPGDPLFVGSDHGIDSKGIIGGLNYLSDVGVNSLFTLLLNLGGDGQDVHPFLGPSGSVFDNTHYDTSRLEQWNQAFEHASRKGIALHFGLAETETANQMWLDGGGLGPSRKIFYREMVARFAHHPAIKWTLIEENDWSIDTLRFFADFLDALDPYDHPIGFHNLPNDFSDYNQVLGEDRFDCTSLQFNPDVAGLQIETWRALSAQSGKPWLMHADEHTPYNVGATNTNAVDLRKRVLYDVLFSGGGIEWYAGWHDLPLGGDLTLEDFRTREEIFQYSRIAREFLEMHVPFWNMEPLDALLVGETGSYGGGEVFALPGETYAIFLPDTTSTGQLDLSAAPGPMQMRWFDPRTGNFVGGAQALAGGGLVSLGSPPQSPGDDWVVLIERPATMSANVHEISISTGGLHTLDIDFGPSAANRPYLVMGSASGTGGTYTHFGTSIPLQNDAYVKFTVTRSNTNFLQNTRGLLDGQGRATAAVNFTPGVYTAFVGTTLHHMAVLHNPIDRMSNPVSVRLVP